MRNVDTTISREPYVATGGGYWLLPRAELYGRHASSVMPFVLLRALFLDAWYLRTRRVIFGRYTVIKLAWVTRSYSIGRTYRLIITIVLQGHPVPSTGSLLRLLSLLTPRGCGNATQATSVCLSPHPNLKRKRCTVPAAGLPFHVWRRRR